MGITTDPNLRPQLNLGWNGTIAIMMLKGAGSKLNTGVDLRQENPHTVLVTGLGCKLVAGTSREMVRTVHCTVGPGGDPTAIWLFFSLHERTTVHTTTAAADAGTFSGS